jgi:riboflavin biosynthesis pyrimidine reductase
MVAPGCTPGTDVRGHRRRYGAEVRQLHPTPGEVDPLRAYLAAPRPAPPDRPWVAMSMVTSLDGATAVDGRSGPLGGAPDRAVFRAVRALADVVLVAAGTVRAEDYGPVRLSAEARDARVAAGRSPRPPRLAVVTASLDLDLRRAAEGDVCPLVLTVDDADPDRRAALAAHAEVRSHGTGWVDLAAALAGLRADGAEVVVCEGGPSLNAALVAADLVDEWCVTLAPAVVGGDSRRVVDGTPELGDDQPLELASLLAEDGVLLGRWLRRR